MNALPAVSPEVAEAVAAGRPVVALETTVVSGEARKRAGTSQDNIHSMRRVLLAIVLVLACRRDRAADTHAGANSARSSAESPSRVSDDELVAFARWQRDFVDLSRRHKAELDAVSRDDPSRPFDDVQAERMPRVQELMTRHAPAMQALLDRIPLKGRKAELVTEAVGGLFHVENTPTGYDLVVARDEVRLRAARRRFGDQAIDDILARESLILAQLPRP
jgi:hypothetical protein